MFKTDSILGNKKLPIFGMIMPLCTRMFCFMLFVDNLKCHAGFIWIQAVMQQNTLLPKNESILNILVYFLEQLQRFSGIHPKMFSTDFIFRQQENLVDNQKCQAGFRPLCNKIPFY